MEGLYGGLVGIGGEGTISEVGRDGGEEPGLKGVLHLAWARGSSDYGVGGLGGDEATSEKLGGEEG